MDELRARRDEDAQENEGLKRQFAADAVHTNELDEPGVAPNE